MPFDNNTFTVRWVDNTGEDRSKVYSDYREAQRAYKWLLKMGATSVDLAIKPRLKPTEPQDPMQYKD